MDNSVGAPIWNIEKIVKKGDYLYAVVRGHPNATKHSYVLYHRVVMENKLGRLLDKNEVVHHVNGDKHDNRLSNLQLATKAGHARQHQLHIGRKMCELKCPECGCRFVREHRATHLVKGGRFTCCSARCRGKLSRDIQLHGLTDRVQKAISENIQGAFRHYLDNAEQTADKQDA